MTSLKALLVAASGLLAPPVPLATTWSFECSSAQPYAAYFAETSAADQVTVYRSHGATREKLAVFDGHLAAISDLLGYQDGQAVAVPLIRDGKPVVKLLVDRRVVLSVPGGVYGLASAGSGTTLLTATTPALSQRQIVLAGDGQLLGERALRLPMGNEGGHQYGVTGDGEGVYQVPTEDTPLARIEVHSADGTFRPLFSAGLDGVLLLDAAMLTPTKGFAIGDGQVFLVDRRGFRALGRAGERYRPEKLEVDVRSRRVLASGLGGYVLYDLDGTRLAAAFGHAVANHPTQPQVRLALDGSIAEFRYGPGRIDFLDPKKGYRSGVSRRMDFEAWPGVQCLTPNSIAYRDRERRLITRRLK